MKNLLITLIAIAFCIQLTCAAPKADSDSSSDDNDDDTSQADDDTSDTATYSTSGRSSMRGIQSQKGTDDTTSDAPDSSSSSNTPVCGAQGYDNGIDSYWDSTDSTYVACAAACTGQSQCKSFSYGNGECDLFDVPVTGNFEKHWNSPYRFYDVACAQSTATTRASVSTTKRTASTTSTTPRRTADTTSRRREISSTPARPSSTTKKADTATSSKRPGDSGPPTRSSTIGTGKRGSSSGPTSTTTKRTTSLPSSTSTKKSTTGTTTTTTRVTSKTPKTTPNGKTNTSGRTPPSSSASKTQGFQTMNTIDAPKSFATCSLRNSCTGSTFSDPCNQGCGCTYTEGCGLMLVPGDLLGNGTEGVSYTACVRLCDQNQPACVGINYYSTYGSCYMYSSSVGTDLSPDGWYASRKSCDKPCPISTST